MFLWKKIIRSPEFVWSLRPAKKKTKQKDYVLKMERIKRSGVEYSPWNFICLAYNQF